MTMRQFKNVKKKTNKQDEWFYGDQTSSIPYSQDQIKVELSISFNSKKQGSIIVNIAWKKK